MKIGRHGVIAVGRGGLPIMKQPEIFRFRLAHEYAHLAANDERREKLLFAVYLAAIALLLISYASSLTETLKVLATNYVNIGLSGIWYALFGWMRFGLIANFILYASIISMLLLERSSASRLREFYADSAAAAAVGPVAQAFQQSASTGRDDRWYKRLFMRHPPSIERANTVANPAQAHRADLMLFLLQGYFVAFIVEVVLQLLFTAASPTLATHDDRRDSLLRYLEIGSVSTFGIIVVGALLGCAALYLTVSRLNVSLTFVDEPRARSAFMVQAPLFVVAGMFLMLTTSQSTAWDLKQTDWNLPAYVLVAWDRLLIHGLLLFSTCIVIGVVLSVRPKAPGPLLSLSAIPMVTTALTGYFLYR
nr:M48 family metalloprotease [Rhizobium anhuiense]